MTEQNAIPRDTNLIDSKSCQPLSIPRYNKFSLQHSRGASSALCQYPADRTQQIVTSTRTQQPVPSRSPDRLMLPRFDPRLQPA